MKSTTPIRILATGEFEALASHVNGETLAKLDDLAFDPSRQPGLVVTEAEMGLLLSMTGFGPGLPLFTPDDALRSADRGEHESRGGKTLVRC
jgi:hypothetical protein